jgi:hypothetical protein
MLLPAQRALFPGQVLHLQGNGGSGYVWHPSSALSASNGIQRLDFMSAPKFVHDDIVQVKAGQIGTIKEVHQSGNGYVYGVQLRTDTAVQIDLPEDELQLVKIANDDETGFAIRYIS